jgi:hypothetical protein
MADPSYSLPAEATLPSANPPMSITESATRPIVIPSSPSPVTGTTNSTPTTTNPNQERLADNPTPTNVLVIIVAIIVILFLLWLAYLMITSFPNVIGQQPLACAPGQCATNIYNGEKTCLGPNDVVYANPSYQVCNSPTLCENGVTPFALQDDRSTNTSGACPPGVICRCLTQQQCPDYIVSNFNTINGNAYTSLTGTRTAFVQSNVTQAPTGGRTNTPPLAFSNTVGTFCTVPLDFLPRSSPGCPFLTEINSSNYLQCFNSSSACLVGTLAFIPDSVDNMTLSAINSTPIGCVRGTPCTGSNVAVWDNQLGAVVCKELQ